VDIHAVSGASATARERDAIDAVLGPPASGWDGGRRRSGLDGHVGRAGRQAREKRHLLLPALHAAQSCAGWISPGALNYLCERLTIPPAEAYGVASFYAMFSLEPAPPTVVHLCDDIACRMSGARQLEEDLEARLGPAGAPPGDAAATWRRSPCLGLCESAPAALVVRAGQAPCSVALAPVAPADLETAIAGGPPAPAGRVAAPQTWGEGASGLSLLARVGRADPRRIDAYRAHGGYDALRRAIALGPEGVLREVADANLVGRGGAAFPAGRKWRAVAGAAVRPHYLVCNADESEPGTFKDRILMEEDPFAIVESMTIAGYATGCERGFIYLRAEYPLSLERLSGAIAQARSRGLLGEDVMGAGFRFDVEIRSGAGAYICGEETALFNSIEGFRGEPRNKPPFPTQEGLFGKPTLVNNVETLANVPLILANGGPVYAATGTRHSSGTKLFSVSGRVGRPGVYEVPFGTTLRGLIELAGGVAAGRRLAAVLLGGAAGTFLTPAELDIELTFEATRANGAALGSGVVMVFDDTVDMADIVLRIAGFFREESCGQCVPCRVGTVRQEEALERLRAARGAGDAAREIALVDDLAMVMRDASICGLGQTASNAVQSALLKLGVFGKDGRS